MQRQYRGDQEFYTPEADFTRFDPSKLDEFLTKTYGGQP